MAEDKVRETEPSEKPRRGKNSLVLIVIIGVLVALLIGGGIAAAIVLTKGSSAKAEPAAEPASEVTPGKKAKKEAKKEGPKAPAIYVGLEPPFVVNFDASQSSRFLQVTVEIMTRDSDMAKMLQQNDPAVRNDLLMLFGGQNATEIGTREGKETLRKAALTTVRQLISTEGGKPELVEAIYFTTFVMQ